MAPFQRIVFILVLHQRTVGQVLQGGKGERTPVVFNGLTGIELYKHPEGEQNPQEKCAECNPSADSVYPSGGAPVLAVIRRVPQSQTVTQPENMVQIPGGQKQGTEKVQVHAAGEQRHLHKKARQAPAAVQSELYYKNGVPSDQCPPGGFAGHLQAQRLHGGVGMQFGGLGVPAGIQEKLLLGTDEFPAVFGIERFLGGERFGRNEIQPAALQTGGSQPIAHGLGQAAAKPGQRPAQLFHKQALGGHISQPAFAGFHLIARAGNRTVNDFLVEQFHPGHLLSSGWRAR